MKTIDAAQISNLTGGTSDQERARVLVVGDDCEIREMLSSLLSEKGFYCSSAANAQEARDLLAENEYALVIADVDLSGLSGLNFVMELEQQHPDTAVCMVTGADDPSMVGAALEMGAYGYMVKPVERNEVLINVANALRLRTLEKENRTHREKLEQLVRTRTEDLKEALLRLQRVEQEVRTSREETIERLSIAAEFRDNETQRHIKRVSGYCELLARAAGEDEDHCEMIRIASQLHDVGKIGIPDALLLKTGRLTEEEREAMKEHTELGYRILSGTNSEVLSIAASIALTHHERFDGTGYPRGLAGESIPLEGRIMAVADVFDGLTSDRVYKSAVPIEEAIEVMRAESEHQLDPDLVDLFLTSMDYVLAVKEQFQES